MQLKQGNRLKYFIERSGKTVKEIAEKSAIPRASIYDFYKKDEILPSKIEALINVIGISKDEFYNKKVNSFSDAETMANDDEAPYELSQMDNIEAMLKQVLAQNKAIISLLNNK